MVAGYTNYFKSTYPDIYDACDVITKFISKTLFLSYSGLSFTPFQHVFLTPSTSAPTLPSSILIFLSAFPNSPFCLMAILYLLQYFTYASYMSSFVILSLSKQSLIVASSRNALIGLVALSAFSLLS